MIEDVNETNYNEVLTFLEESKLINNIDPILVKCASVIKINEKIYGILSYELSKTSVDFAIIRYFIFKKTMNKNEVLQLIEYVSKKLKALKLSKLIALASNKEIFDLLIEAKFEEVKSSLVFVDEINFQNSKMKKVIPLKLDI